MWAIAAIFGDLPADSPILVLLEDALKELPAEEALVKNCVLKKYGLDWGDRFTVFKS